MNEPEITSSGNVSMSMPGAPVVSDALSDWIIKDQRKGNPDADVILVSPKYLADLVWKGRATRNGNNFYLRGEQQ